MAYNMAPMDYCEYSFDNETDNQMLKFDSIGISELEFNFEKKKLKKEKK